MKLGLFDKILFKIQINILEYFRVASTNSIAFSKDADNTISSEHDSRFISVNESISVVTNSKDGKKIFVGTYSGRVLMYESGSFGLIHQPSYCSPLNKSEGMLH